MINYFTKSEAQAKVGKRVKTKIEFYQLPAGTTGKVTGIYSGWRNESGVDITWNRNPPITDGFSKDEYEEFIEELS